jgi:superkiller protein 3
MYKTKSILSLMNFKNITAFVAFLIATSISIHAQDEVKSAASLYNDGLALLKEKNYNEGLPIMEEALLKGTEEGNEKVIELSKKNGAIAAYNVAKSKVKEKNLEEAIALYNKGIEMNPKYSSNYSGLANVYKKQKNLDLAVDNYLKATEVANENKKTKRAAKNMKSISVIVGKQYVAKNYDTAIGLGKKALGVKEHALINYYVSRSFESKKDHQAAFDHATKAIELGTAADEMEDKYYVALAEAHVGLGQISDAIKAYEMIKDDTYLEQAKYQINKLKG